MEQKQHRTFTICIVIGLIAGAFLKFFVIDIIHISGSSMSPTIENGATLIVNKLSYGLDCPFGDKLLISWAKPKVGDIVVFMRENNMVIKRCLAVYGTKLEYSTDSGYTLNIDDISIKLTAEQYYRMKDSKEVPKDTILVIGDNHEISVDSRTYGFVSTKNILGKVLLNE